MLAGLATGTPALAAAGPAAADPLPTRADAAAGVQTAQQRLAAAEQKVRSATERAQQLATSVVALQNQLNDAEQAVVVARAGARKAIREAYDDASVDPTADLLASLNGGDPDLASRLRARQLGDAAARARSLAGSVKRLTALRSQTAHKRTDAVKAAAAATGAAEAARRELAAAIETQQQVRSQAELAAQRKELEQLKADLAKTLAALRAASTSSASGYSGIAITAANLPTDLRSLYMNAAKTCPGLPWSVLAGIGQVETGHGQNKNVSSAGAMGPMQFMPATWEVYGIDGDGDGVANILDQADAVFSAAKYLCASGGGNSDTLYQAIYAYNHSDYYVQTVLAAAAQYH